MLEKYFIHGNGQTAQCAPKGFSADTMPGHNPSAWNKELYSIEKIVEFYAERIPSNALVLGHSLGGHIGLNVAVKRPDISLVLTGMAPVQSLATIGDFMTPPDSFVKFQSPTRTPEEVRDYCRLSSGEDKVVEEFLIAMASQQDPEFNMTLFSEGIQSYDWNELEKARSLGSRLVLVLSYSEFIYVPERLESLGLPMIKTDYSGHTPWLNDAQWIDWLETELALRSMLSATFSDTKVVGLNNHIHESK